MLLSADSNLRQYITYGGYQSEDEAYQQVLKFYDPTKNTITSHRLAGGFHWELSFNFVHFGNSSF